MRALRERPRVAAATALGTTALIACGAGLGAVLASNGPEISQATQVRLVSAERTTQNQGQLLRTTWAELNGTRIALVAATRRSRVPRRTTARLRRELRQAKRALRRERRRR